MTTLFEDCTGVVMPSQGREGVRRYRRLVLNREKSYTVVQYNRWRLIVHEYWRPSFLRSVEIVGLTNCSDKDAEWIARGWPKKGSQKMKRKVREDRPADRHATMDGLDSHPEWADWMTASQFDDGKPRTAPSMSVFCAGGEWKCSLRDRAEGLVLWLSARTWGELMSLVEELVMDETAPWRRDEWDGGDGKRVKRSKA